MRAIKFMLRFFFSVVFTGVFLVILGLPVFYFNIASAPTQNNQKADAIIVLTGSADRIPEAIKELNDGFAEKLFISGVGQNTKASELMDSLVIGWKELVKVDVSRVSLGYEATDTVGNARESKTWIEENNIKSIRLVTSNYHMARAHLEFRKIMPKLEVIESPVIPAHFNKADWKDSKPTRDLIVKEYFKYLYSWLGLNEKES